MARFLLLARHGQVGPAYAGRYVGRTDPPLDEAGLRQAGALGRLLARFRPARCFTSPLRRAIETADVVATALGLAVEVAPDLREIDFGLWDGKTFGEIQEIHPEAVGLWAADIDGFTFPGGEPVAGFAERVRRAVDRLAADPAEAVLAVTHGGVIRVALCHLLGLPLKHHLVFDLKPASLAAIELFDGKGMLAELNNSSCLEE